MNGGGRPTHLVGTEVMNSESSLEDEWEKDWYSGARAAGDNATRATLDHYGGIEWQ